MEASQVEVEEMGWELELIFEPDSGSEPDSVSEPVKVKIGKRKLTVNPLVRRKKGTNPRKVFREKILMRLHVATLIRCKRVCKYAYDLISSSRFIMRFLDHTLNQDRCNRELSQRRITIVRVPKGFSRGRVIYENHRIVGSANGLICIINPHTSLVVLNPWTNEEKRPLEYAHWDGIELGWGFGYDPSQDDYKVVVGVTKDRNQISIWVWTVRSNSWTVVSRDMMYRTVDTNVGVYYSGSLHWVVTNERMKHVILSYDLATGQFNHVSQPEDPTYKFTSYHNRLGIVQDCLCVFDAESKSPHPVWLMRTYGVRESWEHLNLETETWGERLDTVHHVGKYCLNGPWNSWSTKRLSCWENLDAPLFTPSLVSPYVRERRWPFVRERRWPNRNVNKMRSAMVANLPVANRDDTRVLESSESDPAAFQEQVEAEEQPESSEANSVSAVPYSVFLKATSKKVITREEWEKKLNDVKIRKEDMNKWVTNFLVTEGYVDTAEKFRMESGTEPDIDFATITDRMAAKKAVQSGNVEDTVEKVNDLNDPEQSCLEELERTDALLDFEDVKDIRAGDFLDISQRLKTPSEVNAAILTNQLDEKAAYPRINDLSTATLDEVPSV